MPVYCRPVWVAKSYGNNLGVWVLSIALNSFVFYLAYNPHSWKSFPHNLKMYRMGNCERHRQCWQLKWHFISTRTNLLTSTAIGLIGIHWESINFRLIVYGMTIDLNGFRFDYCNGKIGSDVLCTVHPGHIIEYEYTVLLWYSNRYARMSYSKLRRKRTSIGKTTFWRTPHW